MAKLTDHNVVGTFPDLDAARNAIQELNDAGIDADDISMLGKQVEDVSSDPDTRLRDMETTADLAQKAAKTATIGSVVGGIAGAAAFLIPGLGPVIGAGIWAAAGGGAIAGGVVGGMMGAIEATELGPEWEVSYGDPLREGKVLVAVHARDDQQAQKAADVLGKEGAGRVDHLDVNGKPLDGESGGDEPG
jgi:outer membrane lipoprotein SlyB